MERGSPCLPLSPRLGVTEPAMYGINLKYRFPMLCAMISSGLAGLLCGLNGVMANGIGVGGLPGILSIQPSYWRVFALAMAIAIIIPIVLHLVYLSAEIPHGHAGHCLIFFGAQLRPSHCRNNVMTHLPTGGKTALSTRFIQSFQDTRVAAARRFTWRYPTHGLSV